MNVLVSGAGVAGLALAVNLSARGHQVTVVERSSHFRVNGSPIDIRGDSLQITEKMGLLGQIKDNRVRMSELSQFVDSNGDTIASFPADEASDSPDDVEIAREDLANILAAALPSEVTVRFLDSLDSIADDGAGVDVHFVSGLAERYDLVFGADGQHSGVRRLAFGPESDYLRHLGLYVALADLPEQARPDRMNPMYNYPGHLGGIARYKDKALAVLMFRSALLDYDYHDLGAQKKILTDAFAGHTEWKLPELLDAARRDPELYFDSVSQIHMDTWHKGRVALVGDAAHCAALLSGRGTSLALTGAYFVAEELGKSGGDHTSAFENYETRQRPYVTFAQASVGTGGATMVPETQEDLDARNERVRAMSVTG